jgi:hypothetical protein
MPKVTSKRRLGKPKPPTKPYADFPIFAHESGEWCKKIRGKQFFFGVWADPDAADAKYERERPVLSIARNRSGRKLKRRCRHTIDCLNRR